MPTHILVVDDEKKNLDLFQALLKKHLPEAEVWTASSGGEALARLSDTPPDIVLLDARMPDMDGFEVCREIKTNPETANIPVLMVSGVYIQDHHRVSGFEGGADAYICKPFKAASLVAQIRALLEEKKDKEIRFRVMVVDGSRISRQVLAFGLKQDPDVDVASFESAESALAALDAVMPDLVVCDVNVGEMGGEALCKKIHGRYGYGEVPVVLLTQKGAVDQRGWKPDCDAAAVLTKPVKPEALLDYVGREIDLRRDRFDYEVLLVGEASSAKMILRENLTGIRLQVYESETVEQARGILDRENIDLLVLSNDPPDPRGIEWCSELRSLDEYKWMPIVGFVDDGETGVAFIKAGADDYLTKELPGEEMVVRIRNLLKRVSLTSQLNLAVQRERALNEYKNRILGIAAHDIRSPVSAISHFAELLLATDLEDPNYIRSRIETIHGLSRHALAIVNDVLDAKSIQSGVIEIQSVPFDMEELLRERLAFMNDFGEQKGVRGSFITQLTGDKKAIVQGDRRRLAQVIDNLIGNAIKYCREGDDYEVRLSSEVEGWLVEVEDKGPGIPRDELFGVFDEFGKTSVQASGGEKSTGLGLAIAKKLVELHGGTIWIESKVGQGTRISFVLPEY